MPQMASAWKFATERSGLRPIQHMAEPGMMIETHMSDPLANPREERE